MEQDLKSRGPVRWGQAQGFEKELHNELNRKNHLPRFEDIDKIINLFRAACEKTIFTNIEYAATQDVDQRLWAAHGLIKERYKKLIAHYRDSEPRKHVEKRKIEQRYANFIKTTQFHYKHYIQHLALEFGGLDGLCRIADRLSLAFDNTQPHPVLPAVRDLVERSCHTTLLHLGDLSRYRNEIRSKDRSWEPALGYYGLAADLCPDSGSSHNQMAVIALADANHLDAVYHLYRAIAVKNPHPLAEGNLEIEFKKIITGWERAASNKKSDSQATLVLWFVRLHARFYSGAKFSGHDELETEVLSRLALLLKEQSFEVTLQKLILINIAAEYYAGERVRKEGAEVKQRSIESFYFFLRFNIRFLSVLLQTILPELEVQRTGDSLPNANGEPQPDGVSESITSTCKRVLPALRQYSSWLVSRALIIIATVDKQPISQYIQDMWRMYAKVLTKLFEAFPVMELPIVDYLLEEDKMTIGFKPFCDPDLPPASNFFTGEDGQLKPRSTREQVPQDLVNHEMKGRIRDIILCALVMRQKPNFPINLNSDTFEFTYIEKALPRASLGYIDTSTSRETTPRLAKGSFKAPEFVSSASQSRSKVHEPITGANQDDTCAKSVTASESQGTMDSNMHRMVDDLLEPPSEKRPSSNETSYGMHTLTANEIFAPLSSASYQLPTINPRGVIPSLPGIWGSPFAPQPNELAHNAERQSSANNLSPGQLATRGQQAAAAASLEGMTSFSNSQSSSWTRRDLRPSTDQAQSVVGQLHESLAQRYTPISPSTFSSSSIYANNTPPARRNLSGEAAAWAPIGVNNGNNTTVYDGASDFDTSAMLQSSFWNVQQAYTYTPPGGQGD